MHIDPRVFLSRPQDLSLEGGVSLADARGDAAIGADRIIILSAYYGTGYLVFCPGNSLTKSRELLEDGVSGSGPHEGL